MQRRPKNLGTQTWHRQNGMKAMAKKHWKIILFDTCDLITYCIFWRGIRDLAHEWRLGQHDPQGSKDVCDLDFNLTTLELETRYHGDLL